MKVLLLGADGQLGFELHRSFSPLAEVHAATVNGRLPGGSGCLRVDFTAPGELRQQIERLRPDWVINAAAYTQVDCAEDEPALADRINAAAVAEIGQACSETGAGLLHFSTDYVFDGGGQRAWREDDPPAPINAYGRSKLAGEQAVQASGCQYLILRTAWVYAARGQNFLRTALRLATDREEMRVVDDQIGSPTPARWLAVSALQVLVRSAASGNSGLWHVAGGGECSWYDFAKAIYEDGLAAGVIVRAPRLAAVPSDAYPTRARRPRYSRLDCSRIREDFGIELPDWRIGLRQVLAELA